MKKRIWTIQVSRLHISGGWYWDLQSKNLTLYHSGTSYSSEAAALRAAKKVAEELGLIVG